jgi:hypothetical protein
MPFFLFLVYGDTCHDQIHLNSRSQISSVYCSSCSTYIDGYTSAPIIQIELPSLTQLTGIFVQNYNETQEPNSVRKKKKCFIVYLFLLYI